MGVKGRFNHHLYLVSGVDCALILCLSGAAVAVQFINGHSNTFKYSKGFVHSVCFVVWNCSLYSDHVPCCNALAVVFITLSWSPETHTITSTLRKIEFSYSTNNTSCCLWIWASSVQFTVGILQKWKIVVTTFLQMQVLRMLHAAMCVIYTHFEIGDSVTRRFRRSINSVKRVVQQRILRDCRRSK